MRKISLIVIHCSATRVDRDFTAKDVDTAHRYRGFSCWGYHYYIRKSGEVEPMRDEDTTGAHARGYNAISLGVCYEGGLDENGKAADTRTPRQKEALHHLVKELLQRYINGKTNCSLFSKHFAQDFVLLTQNKMYILLFPIICFSDFVLSLLLLS